MKNNTCSYIIILVSLVMCGNWSWFRIAHGKQMFQTLLRRWQSRCCHWSSHRHLSRSIPWHLPWPFPGLAWQHAATGSLTIRHEDKIPIVPRFSGRLTYRVHFCHCQDASKDSLWHFWRNSRLSWGSFCLNWSFLAEVTTTAKCN